MTLLFPVFPQLGANLILLVTTNVLGILSFYLSDKKQRRAFLDTRQSLEMKLVIEEQAKEQVRTAALVILPHVGQTTKLHTVTIL